MKTMNSVKTVVANWKMNGSTKFVRSFAHAWECYASKNMQPTIAPPYHLITTVQKYIPSAILVAQDCSRFEEGAYTGDVSAAMLADIGCRAVIVGHSERRQHFGEDDATVAQKVLNVQKAGLLPILCVGENKTERIEGRHFEVVDRQLKSSLDRASDSAIIAYEPIWAIGSGIAASPVDSCLMHAHIVKAIETLFGKKTKIPILYGGSVKASNAEDFFQRDLIDGALVGGASLEAQALAEIMNLAQSSVGV